MAETDRRGHVSWCGIATPRPGCMFLAIENEKGGAAFGHVAPPFSFDCQQIRLILMADAFLGAERTRPTGISVRYRGLRRGIWMTPVFNDRGL